MSSPDVVIYGATGLTGRLACEALDRAGIRFAISGRDPSKLAQLRSEYPSAPIRIADVGDPAALAAAFAETSVVLNCAGPARALGERLLTAALSARAHYVDVSGDQSHLHDMYVRHESTARHSQRVCMLGAAVECVLGDLAASWAAAHVCGVESDGQMVRCSQGARVCEESPLDDIAISYVFDNLVLSPSGQRAVFDGLHARGLTWRRDRWEPVAPGSEHRRISVGPDMGGERDVASFPGGDVITIPRYVATRRVQTFVSTSRRASTTTALRLLARAMPALPRQLTGALVPYFPTPDEYARTQFAVIAQARRGTSAARVSVRGNDVYRTSAHVAAWVVRQLVARTAGPLGMRTPSELFLPQPGLTDLAAAAYLGIETSFG